LERVLRSSVKRYNAEAHTQSIVEAVLDLRRTHGILAEDVERIDVDVFKQAYNIVAPGGKEAGNKDDVFTKEQADHSIPYIVAVALLDGDVTPAQYLQERIVRADVQHLLRRVHTDDRRRLTRAYPDRLPCRVRIRLHDGRDYNCEKDDYEGFFTRPMAWDDVVVKFLALTEERMPRTLAARIVDRIEFLETLGTRDLTTLLTQVPGSAA